MSRERREVRTQVSPNLLDRLQSGVTAVSRPTEARTDFGSGAGTAFAQDDADVQGGRGSGGFVHERRSWGMLKPRKRQPRTTLSMPVHVGERARRLTMALTLLEVQDVSLGATLDQALELLEAELRKRGATIPEASVALRTGKRHA